MVPASLGRRLLARLVDGFVLSVPAILLVHAISQSVFVTRCVDQGFAFEQCAKTGPVWLFSVETWLLLFLLTAVYELVFVATIGATPGKWVLDMRVLDLPTGTVVRPHRILARYATLCVTGSVLTLGWWSPLFDRSGLNRGWHDRAGRAVVVRESA